MVLDVGYLKLFIILFVDAKKKESHLHMMFVFLFLENVFVIRIRCIQIIMIISLLQFTYI